MSRLGLAAVLLLLGGAIPACAGGADAPGAGHDGAAHDGAGHDGAGHDAARSDRNAAGNGAAEAPAPAEAAAGGPAGARVAGAVTGEGTGPDLEPVPAAYRDLAMPPELSVDGAAIFASTCAPCHGTRGRGDGPASVGLHPPPAAFAAPGFLSARSDAYLYWRISEGKRATPMPAFKYQLSPEQRWALVRYLRQTWGRATE